MVFDADLSRSQIARRNEGTFGEINVARGIELRGCAGRKKAVEAT